MPKTKVTPVYTWQMGIRCYALPLMSAIVNLYDTHQGHLIPQRTRAQRHRNIVPLVSGQNHTPAALRDYVHMHRMNNSFSACL
jgi:hypothetical protein